VCSLPLNGGSYNILVRPPPHSIQSRGCAHVVILFSRWTCSIDLCLGCAVECDDQGHGGGVCVPLHPLLPGYGRRLGGTPTMAYLLNMAFFSKMLLC
jgi:hypothetical protein